MRICDEFDRHWLEDKKTGCWNWQRAVIANGYGHLQTDTGLMYAHRFSWQKTNGTIPAGMQVLHCCDNRKCVNPAHLFLGTNADNVRDMLSKKRHRYGERHPNASLTNDQVSEIRKLRGTVPLHLIGKKFGVSASTVCDILNGKRWMAA